MQESYNGYLYPELEDKLSFLFYLMIKNHPFLNGNKRMAVTTLLVTLYGNNKWIKTSSMSLYKLAVEISKSDSTKKDDSINIIRNFIKDNLVDISFLEKINKGF